MKITVTDTEMYLLHMNNNCYWTSVGYCRHPQVRERSSRLTLNSLLCAVTVFPKKFILPQPAFLSAGHTFLHAVEFFNA